ncbi:O-linked N-acetylglucosamine transferase, SPINDLY family protein [Agrobacterium vitis]|uniref:O-linked N-acetylglucosamine transferase, SPINDLY family protein n=1 Tax=Agrobacterium vitis TaxID=373 RepID=UPI0020358428|nr:hypothetical protein [Agrobacterium vitis]MCM2451569.1 hypothetical protein [Agrobacterium vitis]
MTVLMDETGSQPSDLDLRIRTAKNLEATGKIIDAAQAFADLGTSTAFVDPSAQAGFLGHAARLYLADMQQEKAVALALNSLALGPATVDAAYVVLKSGTVPLSSAAKDALIATLGTSNDIDDLVLAALSVGNDIHHPLCLPIYTRLRQLRPDLPKVRMALVQIARMQCNYDILTAEEALLHRDIAAGKVDFLAMESPHANLMWLADERLNRHARYYTMTQAMTAASQTTRRNLPHVWGEKLRIGYLSGDFWDDHATMRLLRSVLTSHDTSRFEIILFCHTPRGLVDIDKGGRQQWGAITSIADQTDDEAEATIRAMKIDIMVDLKGHTRDSRSGLMNRPLAPVHVAWLGFPGSCCDVDCDYVIGDHVVLPDSAKPHYHEKFCRLPDSYQPNDPFHRPFPPASSRMALGVPADRVVIGAFNSQSKNTPETLRLWARILKANPKAMLWMMIDGHSARQSTAAFFKSLGVKQSQLLFAPKMLYGNHIARAQAADFAIDSFPYNGHTTTSDMLWAGLPVITKRGTNFASRVSESLLKAIGLDEVVAQDEDDFVEVATVLINDPDRIARLKAHIAEQRFIAPLFDATRFCRHLEAAYDTMADRARAGLAPDHFDVVALPRDNGSFQRAS